MRLKVAVTRIVELVAVPRVSSSSLLLRLSVAVARIIELVAVPSLSSSSLLVEFMSVDGLRSSKNFLAF